MKQAISARQKLLNTFTIDYLSEVDDRRYTGEFTTKKLTIRDLASLGVKKSRLNGGLYYDSKSPGTGIDEQTDEFNGMIAHLELSLVSTPKWWNLDEITDVNLLVEVYKEVLDFESKFLRGKLTSGSQSGRSSEGGSASKTAQSVNDGSAGPMVDEEVQSALEP